MARNRTRNCEFQCNLVTFKPVDRTAQKRPLSAQLIYELYFKQCGDCLDTKELHSNLRLVVACLKDPALLESLWYTWNGNMIYKEFKFSAFIGLHKKHSGL